MTENKARQPKGIPVGGQFAATSHAEADITIDAPQTYASAADVMETRSEHAQLIFVSYDDKLTDSQIDSILAGDWDAAEDSVLEAFEDHADTRAREEAQELIDAAYEAGTFHAEFDDLDWDDQDEAIQAIRENDKSDPVTDLLRNTPDQLMRTRLGTPLERLGDSSAAFGSNLDTGGAETRKKTVMSLLKDHGANIDAEGVADAVEELVDNGPWDWHEGVRLELIFTGNLEDVVPAPREGGAEIQNKQLTFTSPRVLLIDPWNGSGHEVSVPTTVVKVLGQPSGGSEIDASELVSLDATAGGYSWDDVCGLVKSAYKPWAPSAQWLVGKPDED